MNILRNVSLAAYSGMKVGGLASNLCTVTDRMQLLETLSWAQERSLPVIMIGTGSNVLWRDEGFTGLVIVDRIERFEMFEEDETNVYLTVGGGENWDSVVERSVKAGLSGIEALSLIPGTAGATPIQNVGAYGQDISQVLVTVEAFDTQVRDFVTLAGLECEFGYRTSRFKTKDRGRFFITAITLHLMKTTPKPPFYPALQNYFEASNIQTYSPASVRDAVIAIRTSKLPDPKIIPNNGSFFANPIVSHTKATALLETYPQMEHWLLDDNTVKIAAAWLIDQVGLKDFHDPDTGMATWALQPLVLVNEHANNTANVMAFKQKIIDNVNQQFGIVLQQEPELLP